MSLGLINARSVKNKVPEIVDHVVENKLDVTAIIESWLGPEGHDEVTFVHLVLSYCSHHNLKGETGIALVLKSSINHKSVHISNKPISFEHIEVRLQTKNTCVNLIVTYRPPSQ